MHRSLALRFRPFTRGVPGLRQLASPAHKQKAFIESPPPGATHAAAKVPPSVKHDMFCFQCEQTRNGTGCATTVGVCGKTAEVAALQDLLVHLTKGISQYASRALALGPQYREPDVDRFALHALFSTLTNVNFDPSRFVEYIREASERRDQAKALYERACQETNTTPENVAGPALTRFSAEEYNEDYLRTVARNYGIEARKEALGGDADVVGLQELVVYGLKGLAAYAHHAEALGLEDPGIYKDIHGCLNLLTDPHVNTERLWVTVLKVGEINLRVMSMLDKAHNTRFGHPTPTDVNTTPVEGKCLVVSGHDMNDMEEILKQTEGTGVNVYTHGEMLPAHGYPGLKRYNHLVGHYGGPWQLQKTEFATFPGSIVMTTNCLTEPRRSYKHRIFTRSVTGWPGVAHIEGQDYRPAIEAALKEKGFTGAEAPSKPLRTGYGHNAVTALGDKILEAIRKGAVKDFFVVGGCDGTEGRRSYFTDIAKNASKESVFLTMGCGKYRINRLELGETGGIPRILDMGQCNDAYSAVYVALHLAKALNTDVNSLPLHFAFSWFEQKAVAVLLTLLHLNAQNIRLGPEMPAFVTPNMMTYLKENFKLKHIGESATDYKDMLTGN